MSKIHLMTSAVVPPTVPVNEKKESQNPPPGSIEARTNDVAKEAVKNLEVKVENKRVPIATRLRNFFEKYFCCLCRALKNRKERREAKEKIDLKIDDTVRQTWLEKARKEFLQQSIDPSSPSISIDPNKSEATTKYIEKVLNDPKFQTNPDAFMGDWKKNRGGTEEWRIGEDDARAFLTKVLDERKKELSDKKEGNAEKLENKEKTVGTNPTTTPEATTPVVNKEETQTEDVENSNDNPTQPPQIGGSDEELTQRIAAQKQRVENSESNEDVTNDFGASQEKPVPPPLPPPRRASLKLSEELEKLKKSDDQSASEQQPPESPKNQVPPPPPPLPPRPEGGTSLTTQQPPVITQMPEPKPVPGTISKENAEKFQQQEDALKQTPKPTNNASKPQPPFKQSTTNTPKPQQPAPKQPTTAQKPQQTASNQSSEPWKQASKPPGRLPPPTFLTTSTTELPKQPLTRNASPPNDARKSVTPPDSTSQPSTPAKMPTPPVKLPTPPAKLPKPPAQGFAANQAMMAAVLGGGKKTSETAQSTAPEKEAPVRLSKAEKAAKAAALMKKMAASIGEDDSHFKAMEAEFAKRPTGEAAQKMLQQKAAPSEEPAKKAE